MSPGRWVAVVALVVAVCCALWPDAITRTTLADPSTASAALSVAEAVERTTAPLIARDPSVERVRLEGQVIDEKLSPIGGATVRIGARSTVTEADGSFAFDAVPAASVVVVAERDELYGEERTTPDATSDPIEVTVRRGPTLTIHVVREPDGAPIAGAALQIANREVTTGADGRVVLRGMDPTGETLVVEAAGYGPRRESIELDTMHPLAAHEHVVTLSPAAPISGILVDESGARVPEGLVTIFVEDGTWIHTTTADETGAWTFPWLAAGEHTFEGGSDQHIATKRPGIVHDGVRPTTGVVVTVRRGAELAGRVVDETGAPVAGVTIRGARSVETDAGGRFLAIGLEAGPTEITAYDALRSSEERAITLEAGRRTEIEIVVRAASLAGHVRDRDGNPIADATVYARTVDERSSYFARSDERGRFDFGGVSPGEYTIVAQYDEEARRGLPETNRRVRTGQRDITLVLAPLGGVTGRVVIAGAPARYFEVHVAKAEGWGDRAEVFTEPSGAFARADIAPGTWTVTISGPGFLATKIDDVTVEEGRATDLGTISVDPGRTVHGRVVDERGAPVASAVVSLRNLSRLGRSQLKTRSDASGRFSLVALAVDEEGRLVAETATATSIERALRTTDGVVELVIVSGGEIAGRVNHISATQLAVIATSLADPDRTHAGAIAASGAYRIPRVPPGTYALRVMGRNTLPEITVEVRAQRTTIASFDMPAHPIELSLASPGCRHLSLRGANTDASTSCTDDVATFEGVAAGSYRTCDVSGACADVVVAPAPAQQRIAISLAHE